MLSNIKASNFLSWKDLNFDVPQSITLIDGWNEDDQRSEGSGKSAVLNAISWCAYGKLPKDVNVDDVIKDGEKSCSVILTFDNGDSIVRTRNKNDVYLTKAGAIIKGKDARETQSYIEEYLGCNFETFCQSVYFAQNYNNKFLSSNQEERGKILSSIQNLQVFDKARKETMDQLKVENDKNSKLSTELQLLDSSLKNTKSQVSLIESFIADKIQKHQAQANMLVQQRDLILGHIKRFESDLGVLNQNLAGIDLAALTNDEAQLNEAKSQYGVQLSGVSYQKSQVGSVKKAIQDKETIGTNLSIKYTNLQNRKKQFGTLETSQQYLRLLQQRQKFVDYDKDKSFLAQLKKREELVAFLQNPTKNCPSCGSELKNIDLSHTQKEIEQIDQYLKDQAESAVEWVRTTDEEIQQYANLRVQELATIDQDMADIASQLEEVSKYLDENKVPSLDELNASEAELKNVIAQIDGALRETQQKKIQYSSIQNQINSTNQQIINYDQQRLQYEQSIERLGQPDVTQDQAKLEDLKVESERLTSKLGEQAQLLKVGQDQAERLETLKDGFKEIKTYVFSNALNELNYRTNQYLTELFDTEASIKFTTEEQKIECKIVLNGQERSLGLLSGGQNRRFNLAVDLALSDIVSYRKTSKLELLIFDEYFKDLSEISMEKSLDLLKSRKSPVILIEHNSIFKNIIDNTFFVRLENGTSFESRP